MLGQAGLAAFFVAASIALLVYSWNAKRNGQTPSNALVFLALGAFLVAVILFGIGLIKRNATEMAVTNKRVIVKTGLASRRTVELLLTRIESVVVEEPFIGRMLGYGTVILRGTGGTPEVFPQIAPPLRFREYVQRQISGQAKPIPQV